MINSSSILGGKKVVIHACKIPKYIMQLNETYARNIFMVLMNLSQMHKEN